MSNSRWSEQPHRRLNILSGEWVLVSPHRNQRPWQGQLETASEKSRPRYDPQCYLCPGNQRAGDEKNPDYRSTFAFDNDYAALRPDTSGHEFNKDELLIAEPESGQCRVVCFSPRHDLTIAEMPVEDIENVVELWTEEYQRLGEQHDINYVQIFENKGAQMGCSNPHPHGQIWAQKSVPGEPARELSSMRRQFVDQRKPMLQSYLELELREGERIVVTNEGFVAVVPFWAIWPFEVMILPRRQVSNLLELSRAERSQLAGILKKVTARYDNLFQISFPYSSGIHQAPTDGRAYPECTLHMHFYPPLLRSSTVKKFMVGYEMLAGPQRDITPEASAKLLRELPDDHFKKA